MNDPYIVITAMEEAALYGSVQQVKSPGCVWWGVGEHKQVTFIHGLILKDYSINFIYKSLIVHLNLYCFSIPSFLLKLWLCHKK